MNQSLKFRISRNRKGFAKPRISNSHAVGCYAISSGNQTKNGIFDLFNPALLSYATGVKKPNPEAFKMLMNKLELNASYILFIDDRNENVEAAKNLGIDSIQFIIPQQLEEELEKRGFDLNKITMGLQTPE